MKRCRSQDAINELNTERERKRINKLDCNSNNNYQSGISLSNCNSNYTSSKGDLKSKNPSLLSFDFQFSRNNSNKTKNSKSLMNSILSAKSSRLNSPTPSEQKLNKCLTIQSGDEDQLDKII